MKSCTEYQTDTLYIDDLQIFGVWCVLEIKKWTEQWGETPRSYCACISVRPRLTHDEYVRMTQIPFLWQWGEIKTYCCKLIQILKEMFLNQTCSNHQVYTASRGGKFFLHILVLRILVHCCKLRIFGVVRFWEFLVLIGFGFFLFLFSSFLQEQVC